MMNGGEVMASCMVASKELEQLIFGKDFRLGETGGKLIHIFGKAGSGRTTLALQIACNICAQAMEVFFIDTEGKVSGKRVKEIAGVDCFKKVNKHLKLYRPENFEKQHTFIRQLEFYLANRTLGLIVVDTITNLYRQEQTLGEVGKNNFEKLAFQVALLQKIAKQYSLPVLLFNQATLNKKDNPLNLRQERVSPVAQAIMDYWADRKIILVPHGWGKFEARIPGEFEGRVIFNIDSKGITSSK